MMVYLKWTTGEMVVVRQMRAAGCQAAQIAARLGRTVASVEQKVSACGKKGDSVPLTVLSWTSEALAELRRLRWDRWTHKKIGAALGISDSAVKRKMIALKAAGEPVLMRPIEPKPVMPPRGKRMKEGSKMAPIKIPLVRWSADRQVMLAEMWGHNASKVILAALNAMPGVAIGFDALSAQAKRLGLPAKMSGPLPGKSSNPPPNKILQAAMDGRGLPRFSPIMDQSLYEPVVARWETIVAWAKSQGVLPLDGEMMGSYFRRVNNKRRVSSLPVFKLHPDSLAEVRRHVSKQSHRDGSVAFALPLRGASAALHVR